MAEFSETGVVWCEWCSAGTHNGCPARRGNCGCDCWKPVFAADTRLGLGIIKRITGDYAAATQMLGQVLGFYHGTGARAEEAESISETGTLHLARSDLKQAAICYQQALDLARQIGCPRDEARALAGLGRCALADGQTADAVVGPSAVAGNPAAHRRSRRGRVAAELDSLTGRKGSERPR